MKPEWVISRRKVGPRFEVSVTKKYREPDRRIIKLSKWWWGKPPIRRSSYTVDKININTPEEWVKIRSFIDEELATIAGWQTEGEALAAMQREQEREAQTSESIRALLAQHPRVAVKVMDLLDSAGLGEDGDTNLLMDLIKSIHKAWAGVSERFRASFKELIQRLSVQDEKAMQELHDLLDKWRLQHVTTVSTIILERLRTLDMFSDMIQKDETYELKGDHSIHRVLEDNM